MGTETKGGKGETFLKEDKPRRPHLSRGQERTTRWRSVCGATAIKEKEEEDGKKRNGYFPNFPVNSWNTEDRRRIQSWEDT